MPAKGICGSGLIDAAAVLRQSGVLDAEGSLQREGHPFRAMVCEIGGAPAVRFAGTGVLLTQADIRALQVAKAAVCAGLQMLLDRAESGRKVGKAFLAGGFGRFIRLEVRRRSACFPPLYWEGPLHRQRGVRWGGPARPAASRRERLLSLVGRIHTVSLAEEPAFEQAYLEGMRFPNENYMGR